MRRAADTQEQFAECVRCEWRLALGLETSDELSSEWPALDQVPVFPHALTRELHEIDCWPCWAASHPDWRSP